MQAYDSIKCGCFWTDLMLKGNSLLDYINLFSLREYGKNDKIMLKYFQRILKMLKWKKSTVLFVENIKTLKTLKYHMF